MTKAIYINRCIECPYFVEDIMSDFCELLEGKVIYKGYERVPPICPLKDVPYTDQYYYTTKTAKEK
jgi:hypothetical protein